MGEIKFEDMPHAHQVNLLKYAKERGYKFISIRQGLVDSQPIVELSNSRFKVEESIALSEILTEWGTRFNPDDN